MPPRDYAFFTAEEFATDDCFRRWVFTPTPEQDAYWHEWLRQYPQQRSTVEKAHALLRVLNDPTHHLPAVEVGALIDRTFVQIQEQEATQPHRRIGRRSWWAYAAAAACLLLIGWFGLTTWNQTSLQAGQHTEIMAETVSGWQLVQNNTTQPQQLALPDGSRVTLSPTARLEYVFTDTNRVTRLQGEAFFDVTRNPNRPFLVLTNRLMTRVLGTSFWVRATKTRSTVEVKTGRVSVFRLQPNGRKLTAAPEGVVLTPNQQTELLPDQDRLTKTLVPQPALVELPGQNKEFAYSEAAFAQVLGDLERAYAIDIVFDEDVFRTCQITATLSDESLHEKLRLLCRSIGADYQVVGAQIVILGPGCP